jgi:TPR repeat protein
MKVMVAVIVLAVSCVAQDAKSFYTEAMNNLTGVGANRSELRGVDLMNRAADMGYLPAQLAAGVLYDTGRYVSSNADRAASLYTKAAAQGSHFAEYLLGRMYYNGVLTAGKRFGEKWLQQAAEAGNPFAAYLLGDSIYDRDPRGAIKWFRIAAEQGLPYGQYRLGKGMIDDRILPLQKREAYIWLSVAVEGGVNEAAYDVTKLESDLGTTEAAKAKAEARELHNKIRRAVNPTGCKGWAGELDYVPTVPPLEILLNCE